MVVVAGLAPIRHFDAAVHVGLGVRKNCTGWSDAGDGTQLFAGGCSANDTEESVMTARKRELIEPHKGDRRYARRDATGHFTEKQAAVGRSLAADRRSKSKTIAKKGQGDRGDRKSASR
jgi:hypothetical protein